MRKPPNLFSWFKTKLLSFSYEVIAATNKLRNQSKTTIGELRKAKPKNHTEDLLMEGRFHPPVLTGTKCSVKGCKSKAVASWHRYCKKHLKKLGDY
jgi:hypothetical protein